MLGNQFQATCPAVSTDALLTEQWTHFAITASHPRGESSLNDFSFLPVSPPAVTPATVECSAGISVSPFGCQGRRLFQVLLDMFIMPERGKWVVTWFPCTVTQAVRASRVNFLSGQQLGFRGWRLRGALLGFFLLKAQNWKLDKHLQCGILCKSSPKGSQASSWSSQSDSLKSLLWKMHWKDTRIPLRPLRV